MVELDPERYAAAFEHVEDERERRAMMDGLGLDVHGGFFETSVALHYAREHVSRRLAEVSPCPSARRDPTLEVASRIARGLGAKRLGLELHLSAGVRGWSRLRPFPGYTGHPHRATARSGEVFVTEILRRYDDAFVRVFHDGDPPPPPIMRWMRFATLFGALETLKVPVRDVSTGFE